MVAKCTFTVHFLKRRRLETDQREKRFLEEHNKFSRGIIKKTEIKPGHFIFCSRRLPGRVMDFSLWLLASFEPPPAPHRRQPSGRGNVPVSGVSSERSLSITDGRQNGESMVDKCLVSFAGLSLTSDWPTALISLPHSVQQISEVNDLKD